MSDGPAVRPSEKKWACQLGSQMARYWAHLMAHQTAHQRASQMGLYSVADLVKKSARLMEVSMVGYSVRSMVSMSEYQKDID